MSVNWLTNALILLAIINATSTALSTSYLLSPQLAIEIAQVKAEIRNDGTIGVDNDPLVQLSTVEKMKIIEQYQGFFNPMPEDGRPSTASISRLSFSSEDVDIPLINVQTTSVCSCLSRTKRSVGNELSNQTNISYEGNSAKWTVLDMMHLNKSLPSSIPSTIPAMKNKKLGNKLSSNIRKLKRQKWLKQWMERKYLNSSHLKIFVKESLKNKAADSGKVATKNSTMATEISNMTTESDDMAIKSSTMATENGSMATDSGNMTTKDISIEDRVTETKGNSMPADADKDQKHSNRTARSPSVFINVCPVIESWSDLNLAVTENNELVQIIQGPQMFQKQWFLEERCRRSESPVVPNISCIRSFRLVRAVVIFLDIETPLSTQLVKVEGCKAVLKV
ncbi:uncharacterized protein LOC117113934 [Anneissia japonica]|uniref:uncharacterized protein LOC117113934 n=1 Tax=Anneissia japonica TaxID=1529436 RepID=UPI0014256C96|nr:uncharacterized protein LOC117113934 [Anneissia japonica]